ncbi:MAG TPA: hypothetical protein VI796_02435 [Candidatus Thermoplasmatota archaeon]|nr:hypothetical protein [Candidatus Thermoplasmatota archaeon]
MDAHCPQCADYELRAMGRDPASPVPDDLKPCDGYAMSDRFRAWLVERMGADVRAQVGASGLGRMALVKGTGKGKAGFVHPRARKVRQTKRRRT